MPDGSGRVGFIGLGNMGGPMSLNLVRAGFDVVVHDVRREAAQRHLDAGASWADSPAAVGAAGCDSVITMLPTPAHVEAVLLETDGLLAAMPSGTTWIDMSTSVPAVADRVREQATPRGVEVLDAPVSGMAKGAAAGTLQIFVGGDAASFARALPLFDVMGEPDRVLHVGGHGAGYTVKLMLNYLWFAHMIATTEVLTIGARAGVGIEVLRRALIASPANSHFVEHDVRSVLEHADYDESFALVLACKDLGLTVDLAREVGVPVEMAALVDQLFRRAKAMYGDLAGEMAPMRLYEDAVGISLRTGEPG
jgi:3-hydroxyisobutyrate dehydrogenase